MPLPVSTNVSPERLAMPPPAMLPPAALTELAQPFPAPPALAHGQAAADPTATIPSLGITQALGTSIKANLPAPGVNATLREDPLGTLAGTNGGVLRLNAPNPLVLGSSISHWTPAAEPSLLMEPAINSNLTDDLDLTVDLFTDIGWPQPIFADGFEDDTTVRWSLTDP